MPESLGAARAAKALLWLAAVAVGFSAADTYVVVLALPDMMSGVGVPVDELQRAAPIISGFLLGYVAVLPLIGRIADVAGRVPVLVWSLAIFAIGSVITAAAYDLSSIVAGRFLQGLGGGGLVPATLALVADLYPPQRRGLPLGLVSAIQEVGSVLGPVYGAAVLAVGDWRDIFWLNVAVGLVLAAALLSLRRTVGGSGETAPVARGRRLATGLAFGLVTAWLVVLVVLLQQPAALVQDVTYGAPFVPWSGENRWFSPVGAATIALGLAALTAIRPWRLRDALAGTDPFAAGLLTVALAAVVVSFAGAESGEQLLSPQAWYLIPVALAATGGFLWRNGRTQHPLVPASAVAPRSAWGSLALSFLIGVALIAALTGVPTAARVTIYPDSQLDASFVLVRLLLALPVGAIVGGWWLRRQGPGPISALGLVLVSVGFAVMAQWDATSLSHPPATLTLVAVGFGFGLTLAPINAALLEATPSEVHGVASALVVVSRMIGMLIGVSALFAVGLRAFAAEVEKIPPPTQVCGGPSACDAYEDALQGAALAQLEAIFIGASVIAGLAAVLALLVYRRVQVTSTSALVGLG